MNTPPFTLKILKSMTLFLAFALATLHLQAQPEGKKWDPEKLRAERSAFVFDKMKLAPEKQARFSVLYKKYSEEADEMKMERIKRRKNFKNQFEKMSEEEAQNFLEKELQWQEAHYQLNKRYHTEFRKVLSAKEVLQMHMAEREFRQEMIKKLPRKPDGGLEGWE